MKKFSLRLCVLILALSLLAGCSGGSSPAASPAPAPAVPSTTNPPAAPAKETPVVISLAHESNPGESITVAAEKWKELVEQRSNGSIQIKLFPASQLGSKADVIEQILMGEAIIQETDGSFLCEYGAPEVSILSMPYVFDSWDQAWELLKSDWFAKQEKLLSDKGIRVVSANWMLGERQLITTKPVYKVSDLKGMKIRVPNNLMSVAEFECFGATSTPMPVGEVYTAIQQGTVDGQENPVGFLYGGSYYEVCDYLTLSGHVKMPIQWVMSETVWNTLSAEQQKILIETGNEAGLLNNSLCLGGEDETIQKFRDKGVTVIELDDAALQGFKDAILPLYSNPEITKGWSDPDLYKTIRAMLTK